MKSNAQNYNPWLYWFIVLTAVATFLLLGLGGLVTSNEAGMSVPDWPNTYGYNMFAFPISKWMGGIFYEHTHRLLATVVGVLSTVLAIWLWGRETQGRSRWIGIGAIIGVFLLIGVREMPVYLALLTLSPIAIGISAYQFARNPASFRWLGIMNFALVVPQGVLGGLRVTLHMDSLGIVHGALAQLFFVLICALALFTSRWWMNFGRDALPRVQDFMNEAAQQRGPTGGILRRLVLATMILIFVQLILGATMRHQHAGLAIPDFPAAYGTIWPDTSTAAVAHYNAERIEVISENPITAFQIVLQMVHRIIALAVFVLVAVCAWRAWNIGAPASGPARTTTEGQQHAGPEVGVPVQRRLSLFWLALIAGQIALGAWTVWSNKAADVATAHVLVGALSLVTGALWCLIAFGHPATKDMGAPGTAPARMGSGSKDAETVLGAPAHGAFGGHPALATNK